VYISRAPRAQSHLLTAAHEVSLVVVTGDRKGRYQPTPPQRFTRDRLFP